MRSTFWFGTIAAIFTTIAFLPQVIKAHRSKHTKDLSLIMYLLLTIGIILWIIYGFLLNELPIIAANGATLALTIYIVYLKIKYD